MRQLPKSALGLSLAGLVAVAAPARAEILIGGAICLTGVQAPLDEHLLAEPALARSY
jgi:hypothetical protein